MVIINNVIRGVLIPDLVIHLTNFGESEQTEIVIEPFDNIKYAQWLDMHPVAICTNGGGVFDIITIQSAGSTNVTNFYTNDVFIAFQKI